MILCKRSLQWSVTGAPLAVRCCSLTSPSPQVSPSQTTGPKATPRGAKRKRGVAGKGGEGTPSPYKKSPWKLREQRFSRHIANLVKKSRQEEAVTVLEQMKRSRVRPDEVVYNTILSGYAKQGNVKLAFKTFNELKKRALLPTDHTYSSMFAACGAAGPAAAPILDKVRAEMERRDVLPNTIAINAMISALALCGRVQEAMQLYLDMSKMHSEPDLCTFGALLLAVGKDKTRGLGVAKRVWSEMLASGHRPDLYSYNMMLQILRDAGLEGVVSEDKGQPQKRVIPVINVEKLPERFDSKGKVGGAKLEERTKETDNKKNADSSTWLAGDTVNKIVLHLRGKVNFELCPGHSLELCVGSLQRAGPVTTRWLEQHSIETLYSAIKQTCHLKPDMHTFHLLVHLTLDPSHLLVTMRERKIFPDNKFMVAAVTQQARQLQSLQGAKVLLQYSRNIGLDLGQVGYQAVAVGCQEPKDGVELLKKMKMDQVQPNHHVMGTLIGHAVRTHNYEYLTQLVRVMMHLTFEPNNTILEMLDAAATRKLKGRHQINKQNGFRGFYTIWKRKVCPDQERSKESNYEEYSLQ